MFVPSAGGGVQCPQACTDYFNALPSECLDVVAKLFPALTGTDGQAVSPRCAARRRCRWRLSAGGWHWGIIQLSAEPPLW